MGQPATIKSLIVSAAEGASEGVDVLQNANIPVELDEFEIEVTYAAETEITASTDSSLESGIDYKFVTLKTKIGHTLSARRNTTYGLKVRFVFNTKEKE